MFGIGPQELVIVGLLALIAFGPKRMVRMSRDLGRFIGKSNAYVEEFESELVSDEVHKARRTVDEVKGELSTLKKGPNGAHSR